MTAFFVVIFEHGEVFGNFMLAYIPYCSNVHFRRITSIYQPTNAHIISHKTLLEVF